MDYESTLKLVRQQNPKMPYKEAQKKAKDMYAKFKQAQAELKNEKIPVGVKTKTADKTDKPAKNKSADQVSTPVYEPEPSAPILLGGINVDILYDAEEDIRKMGINRNSIIQRGRQAIPDGKLVVHGKDGVNKLVTFENDKGDCIPINGYFKIFMP